MVSEPNPDRERLVKAMLVDTIRHRQSSGTVTTLRDLHRILEVPQPAALKAARELESEGIAVIEANISDAFASIITVSDAILSKNIWRSRG